MSSKKITFTNQQGILLSARIDLPLVKAPYPFAVIAHVFTGSKDYVGVREISRALTQNGMGVMRVDFAGLGESEGKFADTNFTSNIEDLVAAADFLSREYSAPQLLVGHSLGGAAVLFAANEIESVNGVVTIGAPSYPDHVTHLLEDSLYKIRDEGNAEVTIGDRQFTIKKQFLEDLCAKNQEEVVRNLRKPLLIMHSPQDRVVEIENAARIYRMARHPKSFMSLDGADHLLTNKKDAFYAGEVISSWSKRYIDFPANIKIEKILDVAVRLEEPGYTTEIVAGNHALIADEPESVGGNDFGPSPYELLNSSLGACTAMTLKMYARRKKWDLQEVRIHLSHAKTTTYAEDSSHFEREGSRLDRFERVIELEGHLTEEQRRKLLEIADKCPVHRTLSSPQEFATKIAGDPNFVISYSHK